MAFPDLSAFLASGKGALARGPVAIIVLEDAVEAASTLRHHLAMGFKTVLAFGDLTIPLPEDLDEAVIRIGADVTEDGAVPALVNPLIAAAPGQWMFYCYNAEYFYFPFCDDRSVGELATFITEERRDAVLTYVVDLYAPDLAASPDAVSLDEAHLDRIGYYALARTDRDNNFAERQLDFFGGLRWRFEEHIPPARRRIDRISLFRARPGLILQDDHTFNVAEYNTYACPWHHNVTAAMCSFRTAKALKRNPGSSSRIETFRWRNSTPFSWGSQQLMDLGLMEPGQWF